jgi:hypothetical protein
MALRFTFFLIPPSPKSATQLHWVIVMNAQGKTRLDKWFTPHGTVRGRPIDYFYFYFYLFYSLLNY